MKYVVIDCAENIVIVGTYQECLNEILECNEISVKYEYRIERASEHGYI